MLNFGLCTDDYYFCTVITNEGQRFPTVDRSKDQFRLTFFSTLLISSEAHNGVNSRINT